MNIEEAIKQAREVDERFVDEKILEKISNCVNKSNCYDNPCIPLHNLKHVNFYKYKLAQKGYIGHDKTWGVSFLCVENTWRTKSHSTDG